MREEFGINLKTWYNIPLDSQDKSIANIVPVLESMDPYVLNSVFQATVLSKSAALGLALIYKDGTDPKYGRMSIEQCCNIARLDEQHQQASFGVVDGAHDFDKANTLSLFSCARSLVSLAKLRDF
jgi:ATP synthase F1 complex assembly factor 2